MIALTKEDIARLVADGSLIYPPSRVARERLPKKPTRIKRVLNKDTGTREARAKRAVELVRSGWGVSDALRACGWPRYIQAVKQCVAGKGCFLDAARSGNRSTVPEHMNRAGVGFAEAFLGICHSANVSAPDGIMARLLDALACAKAKARNYRQLSMALGYGPYHLGSIASGRDSVSEKRALEILEKLSNFNPS